MANPNVCAPIHRSDAVPDHVTNAVIEYFKRPDVSTELPNKKGIKDETARRVLQRSLKETIKGFQDSHAEIKLSKSKFAEMRAKSRPYCYDFKSLIIRYITIYRVFVGHF